MFEDKSYYLDLFKVTEQQLRSLARKGMEAGGSYCDLFFENTACHDLLLRDGIVSSGGFHVDYGVGIRVLDGDRTGYAYSESTDMKAMTEAVMAASKIALGASERPAASGAMHTAPPRMGLRPENHYPYVNDWRLAEASRFVPALGKLQQSISSKDSRVLKVIVSLSDQVSDIMMFNSDEELVCDTRPLGTLAVSVVFSHEGKTENKTVSRSYRTGYEMITDELLEEIANEAVAGIDERFEARRPKGGQMPVVMGAGASGILLHEAMGHAFEADFNRKGQSVFSGKIGQKVCDESISIVDDGTISRNRGAVNFDDEGIPGQKTFMVRDGILTSYLHDRISAAHYGVVPTGNGRRESFRYAPIPRMRATYMLGGKSRKEDIIASVKKGIFVDQFSNGQVQIGEGDFTFFVKSGFLIEEGRLTMPVKDINIIGNGPKALSDIIAVGNDPKIDEGAWTCGKGQSCPVSCGIPTVLINNLTVGGE
ncbi:MAG: TldD/PmbA family protein [Bacteroidales bacterium]|nr:TldD/PmbA family protein [Bacteroidales bacterium]